MPTAMEQLYQQRLARYVKAMRNEKPDRIPIRPFVAEFTAVYAGYTIQEVTQDYEKAFAAARKCAADFDWDAVVGNMVFVWAGLTQAIGLTVLRDAGRRGPAGRRLPVPRTARRGRLDAAGRVRSAGGRPDRLPVQRLAAAGVGRRAADGPAASFRNNMSFLKGGMAMLSYFHGLGSRRRGCGASRAPWGPSRASSRPPSTSWPTSCGATRGSARTSSASRRRCWRPARRWPRNSLHVATSGADPDKNVPIGLWMHRGCVPFLSPSQFERFYWPTLKWIIEELWKRGHQTLVLRRGGVEPEP